MHQAADAGNVAYIGYVLVNDAPNEEVAGEERFNRADEPTTGDALEPETGVKNLEPQAFS
jgi:hypothetical protein